MCNVLNRESSASVGYDYIFRQVSVWQNSLLELHIPPILPSSHPLILPSSHPHSQLAMRQWCKREQVCIHAERVLLECFVNKWFCRLDVYSVECERERVSFFFGGQWITLPPLLLGTIHAKKRIWVYRISLQNITHGGYCGDYETSTRFHKYTQFRSSYQNNHAKSWILSILLWEETPTKN